MKGFLVYAVVMALFSGFVVMTPTPEVKKPGCSVKTCGCPACVCDNCHCVSPTQK